MDKKFTWKEIEECDKKQDDPFALFIYRKFARLLTYFFANYVRLSPNQITILAFLSAILSVLSLFITPWISAFFMILGFTLDCTDGNIARLTNTKSEFGRLLDIYLDRIGFFAVILAISYYYFVTFNDSTFVFFMFLFFGLGSICDGLRVRYELTVSKDIHAVADENFLIKTFKRIVTFLFPFIDWSGAIFGIGLGLLWTSLVVIILIPDIRYYVSVFVIGLYGLYILFLFRWISDLRGKIIYR